MIFILQTAKPMLQYAMVGSAMKVAKTVTVHKQTILDPSVNSKVIQLILCVTECDTNKYFFNSECNASDVNYCKDNGGICFYNLDPGEKMCYCDDGTRVAGNETCTSTGMNGY